MRVKEGWFLFHKWLRICFLFLKFSRIVKSKLQDKPIKTNLFNRNQLYPKSFKGSSWKIEKSQKKSAAAQLLLNVIRVRWGIRYKSCNINTRPSKSESAHREKSSRLVFIWPIWHEIQQTKKRKKNLLKLLANRRNNSQQCWELLRPFSRSSTFDQFQTLRNNSQQHATGCVQTDATCNIQQCRVRLHGVLEIYRRPDNVSGNLYISY